MKERQKRKEEKVRQKAVAREERQRRKEKKAQSRGVNTSLTRAIKGEHPDISKLELKVMLLTIGNTDRMIFREDLLREAKTSEKKLQLAMESLKSRGLGHHSPIDDRFLASQDAGYEAPAKVTGGRRRKVQGPRVKIEPLEMVLNRKKQPLIRFGKIHFKGEGGDRVKIPLTIRKPMVLESGRMGRKHPLRFQGIYSASGDLVTLRSQHGDVPESQIGVFRYDPKTGREEAVGFFNKIPDLDHMLLPEELQGTGLRQRGVDLAERHVRSTQGGSHSFSVTNFTTAFREAGYTINFMGGEMAYASKTGKHNPEDNLDVYHKPQVKMPNGEVRELTVPIKTRFMRPRV